MSDMTPHNDSALGGQLGAFDAYQPPPLPPPNVVAASPSTAKFGRVKAVCIIAIVLGAGGLATALMGTVGLVVGKQMQAAFSGFSQPGTPQPVKDLQLETQRQIQVIQDRFWTVNLVILLGHAIVASLLVAGGIQALRRVRPGRKLLIAACLAAIAFELVRGIVQSVIQVQVLSVTMRFMEQMMEISMDQAADAVEWLVWFSRLAVVAGVLLAIAWILAKLVFYGLAVWYLRKPAVRQYLDTAGAV